MYVYIYIYIYIYMCIQSRNMRLWLIIGQSILSSTNTARYQCKITQYDTIIDKQTVASRPAPAKTLYEHYNNRVSTVVQVSRNKQKRVYHFSTGYNTRRLYKGPKVRQAHNWQDQGNPATRTPLPWAATATTQKLTKSQDTQI